MLATKYFLIGNSVQISYYSKESSIIVKRVDSCQKHDIFVGSVAAEIIFHGAL